MSTKLITLLTILLLTSCSSVGTKSIQTAVPTTNLTATLSPEVVPNTTFDPSLAVVLLSAEYISSSDVCMAKITVKVSGAPVTGSFHVWNAFYDSAGDIYEPVTLPVGNSEYIVGLGGNQPQHYLHNVWFEYNGMLSNSLTNLSCPGLTPSP
jgi:hypothetical protein